MPLSEKDLHRMTGRAAWAADRASLSEDQLDSLFALVGSAIIPDRRAEALFWLNESFAEYVESLRKRPHMLKTLSRYSLPARWMDKNPHIRQPKLSTLARDELQKVERALRKAERALKRLSLEAQVEIRASFWRNRFVGRPRDAHAERLQRIWQTADDHFLCVQAACERMEGREARLSLHVRRELEAVVDAFDGLRAEFEHLTTVTRDAMEQGFTRCTTRAVDPPARESVIPDPLARARSWLHALGEGLECTQIDVRKGRDEAPERALVAALAELYRVATSKEPGRTYRAIGTCAGETGGEAGDFLDLVRTFVGYAAAELPRGVRCGTSSLSQIIRQELKKRKTARLH